MLPFFKKLLGLDTQEAAGSSDEISHINQEVYKKSVELSERNKTLLLLRKIDEIILSSVTDQHEIAARVTSLLVMETDFLIATIFQYDKSKEALSRLAIYETSAVFESNIKNAADQYYVTEVPLTDTSNLIVQAISEKMPKSSNALKNSLLDEKGAAKAMVIQQATGIRSIVVYPLIVRGLLIGAMVIGLPDEEQNISEYKKDLLERLVQVIGIALDNASLYNELQNANEKLKALDKLKDEFVSLASHELRTPMTSVKSYLWMTLQGDAGVLNDTQKLYLNRAYNSVNRLIKLVNDMLNISRIESGRITIELQKVDLYKLTEEVMAEVQPKAAELGVHLAISPPSPLPPVLADPDKIKEVLINLIGNSLKFTPKDGSITVSFSQKGEMVEAMVSDTGAGISPDNLSKLFQKFTMLPESYANNKSATGTGLGLYISRAIMQLHKGDLWAASDGLTKGSRFYFSLKVFQDKDLEGFSRLENKETKQSLGIVHTQL